jgi:hypothetical protein
MQLAIIQADIARHAPIGNRDVRIAVAVQVPDGRVSGRPLRIAIGPSNTEVAFTVVEQNQLWIRLIIAQNHIQVAALGHIRQETPSSSWWLCSEVLARA